MSLKRVKTYDTLKRVHAGCPDGVVYNLPIGDPFIGRGLWNQNLIALVATSTLSHPFSSCSKADALRHALW